MLSQMAGAVVTLVLGTRIYNGEDAIGAGLMWAFSVPSALLLALLVAFLTHRAYERAESLINQLAILLATVTAVLVVSPIVTLGLMRLI